MTLGVEGGGLIFDDDSPKSRVSVSSLPGEGGWKENLNLFKY